MRFLGLAAKAVFLAMGAAVGATVGGIAGGVLAIYLLRTPDQWACVADDSCGPGDGLLWAFGGLPGAFLGVIAGLIVAGVILMRRTPRDAGVVGASDGG